VSRKAKLRYAVVTAVLAALVFAGVFVLTLASGPANADTRIRGVLTGMMVYAQNHDDDFPPPDRMSSLLVSQGILPPEIFAGPASAPGEPAFFALPSPPSAGRWGATFASDRPLIYVNPAIAGGRGTYVGFNDLHFEWVAGADLRKFLADHAAEAVPVR